MAQTQQGQQEILQAVVQQLAQGTEPKQLMEMLTEKGMPPEQAGRLVQAGISYVEEQAKSMQQSPSEKYAQAYSGPDQEEQLPRYEYGSVISGIAQDPKLMNAVIEAMPAVGNMMQQRYGGSAKSNISKTTKKYPKGNYKQGGLSKFLPKAQFGESGIPYAEGMNNYTFGIDPDQMSTPIVSGGAPINTAGPRNDMSMDATQDEIDAQIVQDKHDVAMRDNFDSGYSATPQDIQAANAGNLGWNESGYENNPKSTNTNSKGELDPNKTTTAKGAVSNTDDLKRGRFWWETAPTSNATVKQLQGLANMVVGTGKGVQDVKSAMGKSKYGGYPKYQDAGTVDDVIEVYPGGEGYSDYEAWKVQMDLYDKSQAQRERMIASGAYSDPKDMTLDEFSPRFKQEGFNPVQGDDGDLPVGNYGITRYVGNKDSDNLNANPGLLLSDPNLSNETQYEYYQSYNRPEGNYRVIEDPAIVEQNRLAQEWADANASQGIQGYKIERYPVPGEPGVWGEEYIPTKEEQEPGDVSYISYDQMSDAQKANIVGGAPKYVPQEHIPQEELIAGEDLDPVLQEEKYGGSLRKYQNGDSVVGGGINTATMDMTQFGQEVDMTNMTGGFDWDNSMFDLDVPMLSDLQNKVAEDQVIIDDSQTEAFDAPELIKNPEGLGAAEQILIGANQFLDARDEKKRRREHRERKTRSAGNTMGYMSSNTVNPSNAHGIQTTNIGVGPSVAPKMHAGYQNLGYGKEGGEMNLQNLFKFVGGGSTNMFQEGVNGTPDEWQPGGKRRDMPDFIHIEEDRYAPKKWVNKQGELKKGVKWVDNPNMEKEWFINEEGEEVYAYPSQKYNTDPNAEEPWLDYDKKNAGPNQYDRKLGWAFEDMFGRDKGVRFEDGGTLNFNEGDVVNMTKEQIQRYIQMGGVVELVDENSNGMY